MGRAYDLLVRAKGDTKHAQRSLKDLNQSASNTRKGISSAAIGMAAAIGTIAGQSIINFARESAKELKATQAANLQTQAAIESTGGVANVSKRHVQELADKLLHLSGVDDQLVQAGSNMLLTFTNIRNGVGKGNDVFDQATKASLDMAVAMGTAPKNAALQLGKALQDPAKGLTKLSRLGVQFTEDQKKQVAALVKSGDTMGAQKIILAELSKEFGGSAKKAGQSFGAQMSIVREDLLGMGAALVGKVAPGIASVVSWIREAVSQGGVLRPVVLGVKAAFGFLAAGLKKGVAAFKEQFSQGKKNGAGLKDLAARFGGVIKEVGKFVGKAMPPLFAALGRTARFFNEHRSLLKLVAAGFMFMVAPVLSVGIAMIVAYKKCKTFRDIVNKVWEWVKKLGSYIAEHFQPAMDAMQGGIGKAWEKAKKLEGPLRKIADIIKTIAKYAGKVGGAIGGMLPSGGFGDGGAVGPVSGVDSFTPIASRFGLSMTSGYRPGDDGWHGQNRARDYSNGMGPTSQMKNFATMMAMVYGSQLKELIYSPLGFGIKNGQRVPMSFFGSAVTADHYDHVHVAYRRGGIARAGRPHIGMVGEGSVDEYMIPAERTSRSRRLVAEVAGKVGLGGGVNVTNNFYGSGVADDPVAFAHRLEWALRTRGLAGRMI